MSHCRINRFQHLTTCYWKYKKWNSAHSWGQTLHSFAFNSVIRLINIQILKLIKKKFCQDNNLAAINVIYCKTVLIFYESLTPTQMVGYYNIYFTSFYNVPENNTRKLSLNLFLFRHSVWCDWLLYTVHINGCNRHLW